MTRIDRHADHWNSTYLTKEEDGVSWFEEVPGASTKLINKWSPLGCSVIDIGGGASCLVDTLLQQGRTDVTVLDLSRTGLEVAKTRLGRKASMVHWIACDVTKWMPDRTYDTWHDRAAFHFLTDPADRTAYAERLHSALSPQGVAPFLLLEAEQYIAHASIKLRRFSSASERR